MTPLYSSTEEAGPGELLLMTCETDRILKVRLTKEFWKQEHDFLKNGLAS